MFLLSTEGAKAEIHHFLLRCRPEPDGGREPARLPEDHQPGGAQQPVTAGQPQPAQL